MKIYDAVIIGGGPAGSIAALWAARLGLETAIIEKDAFPRDKSCGDAFPYMCDTLLRELDIDVTELKNVVRLKDFALKIHDQTFEREKKDDQCAFSISRREFDEFLWKKIPSGILKHERCNLVKIKRIKRLNQYSVTFKHNEEIKTLICKNLIAADGANSWVRKNVSYFKKNLYEFATASRLYASSMDEEKYNVVPSEMNFSFEDHSNSYHWMFKSGELSYNIGIYLSYGHNLHETKIENLKRYANNIDLDQSRLKGAPIPSATGSEILAKRNVYLVGDAAGLSDPLVGHGLDAAMLSAKICIQCIYIGIHSKKKLFNLFPGLHEKKYCRLIHENIASRFNDLRNFRKNGKIREGFPLLLHKNVNLI